MSASFLLSQSFPANVNTLNSSFGFINLNTRYQELKRDRIHVSPYSESRVLPPLCPMQAYDPQGSIYCELLGCVLSEMSLYFNPSSVEEIHNSMAQCGEGRIQLFFTQTSNHFCFIALFLFYLSCPQHPLTDPGLSLEVLKWKSVCFLLASLTREINLCFSQLC